MKPLRVLVSGASIAGPTLAHWLHRHGHQVTVVERAPAPRPGGQALDLRGTARQVAERMGVLDAIRAAHTGARGMAFVDANGRRVASLGADLLGDSGGVIAEIEILRGDLVRILFEASRERAEYVFDDSITGLRELPHGIEASFERSPSRTFDLVVGADGLHSNVRRLAFGPDDGVLHDLGCTVAVFPTATRLALDGWMLMHTVPGRGGVGGKTLGLYPTLVSGEARALFYFSGPKLAIHRHDVDAQKRALAAAFQGVGWEAARVLSTMWSAPDFYFDRVEQVRLPRWSKGRVALLGDAAHCASPLAGNGTSMAMVGGYVLAGELSSTPADLTGALSRYEAQMRGYVTRCQRFGEKGVGGLMPGSALAAWVRDAGMRMLPYLPWRGLFFGEVQKIASLITLKGDAPA